MRGRVRSGIGLILAGILRSETGAAQADLATIGTRIVADEVARALSASTVRGYVTNLATQGTWPDIDYADSALTGWEPQQHVRRLMYMTRAYRKPAHTLYGDPAVSNAIHSALGWWLANDPQAANWWYNSIDTPRWIGRTLLVLDTEATAAELSGAMTILGRPGFTRTGQNLIWEAGNVLVKGLLTASSSTVAQASTEMAREVVETTAEGLQHDHSFHQHGPQLYTGGYGASFADDVSFWLGMLRGTFAAFPTDRTEMMANYVLVGTQWVLWGDRWDFGVTGRGISRDVPRGASLSTVCARMAAADPGRAAEYAAFADTVDGLAAPGAALTGNRHFWRSDHMVHRRAGWYASVRMCSTRVQGSEAGNGEGLKDYHLGDGTLYLMRDGGEYDAIQPVWDWRRLPGITAPQNPGALPVLSWSGYTNGSAFVGGAGDGRRGLAAMNFNRNTLALRKAWFFFDDEVVCLGAGVAYTSNSSPVLTTVNQCRFRSAATVPTGTSARTLSTGTASLSGTGWVHQDGLGYLFPDAPTGLWATVQAQTGSWYSINTSKSEAIVTQDVFTLWIDHGVKPTNGAYAYALRPGIDAAAMPAYAADPPFTIVTNSTALQAVFHRGLGLLEAAFLQPGTVTVSGGLRVGSDTACLAMVHETATNIEVSVANPLNQAGTVRLLLNRAVAGAGATWDPGSGTSTLVIDLPAGTTAGATAVANYVRLATAPPALDVSEGPEAAARSAIVHGALTAGGMADVRVVWDIDDRGAESAAWASSVDLPGCTVGPFAAPLSPLAPGTRLVYRVFASNEQGVAWSEPAVVRTLDAAAVSPAAITGCALWLDASDPGGTGFAPTNGRPVPVWTDLSGFARHATATGTPAVVIGGLNGRPAVRLTTGSFFSAGNVKLHSNIDGLTLFAVCRDAEGILEAIVSKNHWSANRREWVLHGADFQVQERSDAYDAACRIDFTSTAASVIYAGRWVPAQVTELFRDGARLGAAALAATNLDDTASALLIGAANNADAARFLDGNVAEVLVFDRGLDSNDLARVGGYLADKYGLATAYPLPANPDADDDGLPDAWERGHFGGLLAVRGGSDTDADRDGASDRDECVAGTDPNDPKSRLEMAAVTRMGDDGQLSLSWPSITGRIYRVQRAATLGGSFNDEITGVAATPTTNTVTVPAGTPAAFFRVLVEP
jgi:chondroitin AC lyase